MVKECVLSETVENILCGRLIALLKPLDVGEAIPESEDCRHVLEALEYFVPHVISEIHAAFRGESLDGILPVEFRKTGAREVELWGGAYLITDQRVVPIHLRFQIDAASSEVSWMECYLGRRIRGTMDRDVFRRVMSWMQGYDGNSCSVDWYYKVGFGEKV